MLEKKILKWTEVTPTNEKNQALHPGEVAARRIPEIPFADCGHNHKHAMIPAYTLPDGTPKGPYTFPAECTHCNPPATPEQLTAHAIHAHRDDSRERHEAMRGSLDQLSQRIDSHLGENGDGHATTREAVNKLTGEVKSLSESFGRLEGLVRRFVTDPSNAPSTIPPKPGAPRQDG